jgi:hypothetical protein
MRCYTLASRCVRRPKLRFAHLQLVPVRPARTHASSCQFALPAHMPACFYPTAEKSVPTGFGCDTQHVMAEVIICCDNGPSLRWYQMHSHHRSEPSCLMPVVRMHANVRFAKKCVGDHKRATLRQVQRSQRHRVQRWEQRRTRCRPRDEAHLLPCDAKCLSVRPV